MESIRVTVGIVSDEVSHGFDHDDKVNSAHAKYGVNSSKMKEQRSFAHRNPYTIFPIFSNLAPPTGHLLTSNRVALRWRYQSRTLLPMSNIESIPVATLGREALGRSKPDEHTPNREKDPDDMAAYTMWQGVISTEFYENKNK